MRARRAIAAVMVVAALLPSAAGRADIEYRTTIEGAEPSDLSDLLDQVSQLKALENRPPPSEEALRRRADRDLGGLTDAARSLGYWDARFGYKIDTSDHPAKVIVAVTPGPLYHVG